MSDSNWFSGEPQLVDWETEIWRRLGECVTEKTSGWRLPVLGTLGSAGVRQRIVVLRRSDSATRTIFAHTDARSSKIDDIIAQSRCSWLFYDADNQVQLQLVGKVSIHRDDEIADTMWNSESESSLRGYLGPLPPGTPCDHAEVNLPSGVRDRIPDRDELNAARSHFAVLSCCVQQAELVVLKRSGNLRAIFDYTSDAVDAQWVAP